MYSFELAVVVSMFLETIIIVYLFFEIREAKEKNVKTIFFDVMIGLLIGTLLAIIVKS